MFTDEPRRTVWAQLRQQDLRAFAGLLTPQVLTQAGKEAGVAMGRGPLCLATMAWLSLGCALKTTRSFADVLGMTLKLLQDADAYALSGGTSKQRSSKKRSSKHDPHPADRHTLSEEAFVQARSKAPLGYWMALILLLGQNFQARHQRLVNWGPHRLLALDGTTLQLPKWKKLAEHYGTARNHASSGNHASARTTQARMVMLALAQVRMPLRYELCPLSRSEKTCAVGLLSGLQEHDLVLMDRGFWSYGLFCQIASQRACFAIRLFAGAKMKTVRTLGPGDRLVRYTPVDRKWKHLPHSMLLRVIRYQVPGFRASAVVTNRIDRRLSRRRWVGLATSRAGQTLHGQTLHGQTLHPRRLRDVYCQGGVYHRRWEIETLFCELKVRQKMEGSIRGRTPGAVQFEVAGHVLLYLLVRWLIVEAAVRAGLDPLRLSYLQALRELLDLAPVLLQATQPHARRVLVPLLLERIASHVVPYRPGRHYPRPGDTKVKNKGRGHHRRPSKIPAGKA